MHRHHRTTSSHITHTSTTGNNIGDAGWTALVQAVKANRNSKLESLFSDHDLSKFDDSVPAAIKEANAKDKGGRYFDNTPLLKYYRELATTGIVAMRRAVAYLVGPPEAGKTKLAHLIVHGKVLPGDTRMTDGIDVRTYCVWCGQPTTSPMPSHHTPHHTPTTQTPWK